MTLAILWNFDPEIVNISTLAPRWYGLMFACAFYCSFLLLRKVWLKEELNEKTLDKLSWFIIIATVLGARLGHVFFYGPWWNEVSETGQVLAEGYFDNPWSILNIREGGLASHGAALGILVSLWLYKKYVKIDRSYLWIVDRLVIAVALGGAFVRFGNFTNSEIIGKPTDSETGIVFAHRALGPLETMIEDQSTGLREFSYSSNGETKEMDSHLYVGYSLDLAFEGSEENFREFISYQLTHYFNTTIGSDRHTNFNGFQDVEINKEGNLKTAQVTFYGLPRHPAQLYESICYLLLFGVLFGLYKKYGTAIKPGLLFGVFLIGLFTARFFIEFIKENQVAFEDGLSLNMGQTLSIPFILVGVGFIIYSQKKKVA